ncbi:hypothetical protein Ct61P_08413 [Colletotrichum tofieldiae]|nr:hypothetical protein Ct61P_08413 [Colletotrichum tofieldiae]
MATAIPSIACIGIIGRNNNPLHIQIFPSHNPATNTFAPIRTPLQFSLLLSSTLDVFELRHSNSASGNTGAVAGSSGTGLSGEVGLLHAVDERLAAYGWETNTGVKIVVVVDMRGRRVAGGGARRPRRRPRGGAPSGCGSRSCGSCSGRCRARTYGCCRTRFTSLTSIPRVWAGREGD